MKILENQKLIDRINELNDLNNFNMSMSELFLSFIDNKDFSNLIKNSNTSNLIKLIKSNYDLEFDSKESEDLFNKEIKSSISILDPNKYLNNPFLKNITIKNVIMYGYELKHDHYKPFELFALDDISIDTDFVEHTKLGYFKADYHFYALNQKNVTWMSIIPNEIETMSKPIKEAFGNVLVLGLGIGYYPYMISLKNEVKKITIIEKDSTIIKLFKEQIFAQFPYPQKIEIIEGDAIDYLNKSGLFNYVFSDLWHNAEDGIFLYLNLKQHEIKNVHYSYWLEASFIALLRRAFITLIYEQSLGFEQDKYNESKTTFDKLINLYYKKTEGLILSSVDQLNKLLENENLIRLIIG